MDDLKSKVVWAIGSGTGIGAAGAEALAVKGGWRWLLLENAEAPGITRG